MYFRLVEKTLADFRVVDDYPTIEQARDAMEELWSRHLGPDDDPERSYTRIEEYVGYGCVTRPDCDLPRIWWSIHVWYTACELAERIYNRRDRKDWIFSADTIAAWNIERDEFDEFIAELEKRGFVVKSYVKGKKAKLTNPRNAQPRFVVQVI